MIDPLDFLERRVLAVLVEKSMAQPDYYPMTLKAIVAACNQKQNRHPVMDVDEDAAWDALDRLRDRGLVTVVLPGPGARSKRFRHAVETATGWSTHERAIMCELLLRGPQTPGELRGRAGRFTPFEDLATVERVLAELARREPPYVTAMPREPGRSAIRHDHLLYSADETDAAAPSIPAPMAAPTAPPPAAVAAPEPLPDSDALQEEIGELHARLADIEARLTQLESRMG